MKRLAAIITMACIGIGSAHATPFDPLDASFDSSLISPLTAQPLTFDTDNLTLNGATLGVQRSQAGGPDVAVFVFGSDMTVNTNITVLGSRALVLLARGSFTLGGTLNVSGQPGTVGAGTGFGNNGQGGAGGPGGFAGSNGFDAVNPGAVFAVPGFGPGGGNTGTTAGNTSGDGPGGGGGFGIAGDPTPPETPGPNGAAYGDILVVLEGGSGGGGGGGVCCGAAIDGSGGGGGGGAIEIGALTELIITGTIRADGGNGGVSGDTNGGGGAGGGILLHAFDVTLGSTSLLSADGALGGGCGGGGRIGVVTNTQGTFDSQGTIQARKGFGLGPPQCGAGATPLAFATADTIGVAPATGGPGTTSVPEPASLALFAVGLGVLGFLRRRRAAGLVIAS